MSVIHYCNLFKHGLHTAVNTIKNGGVMPSQRAHPAGSTTRSIKHDDFPRGISTQEVQFAEITRRTLTIKNTTKGSMMTQLEYSLQANHELHYDDVTREYQ